MNKQFALEGRDFFGAFGVSSLVWSPTGRHIAFGYRYKIYLLDLESGNFDDLVHTDFDWIPSPCLQWSPDGREFLFHKNGGMVYRGSLDSSEPKLVGMANQYTWTPGSTSEVLFWNDAGAYVSDASGNIKKANYAPGILSPNGRWVLLDSDSTQRVRLARANGSDAEELGEYLNVTSNPEWTGIEYLWADEMSWGGDSNQILFARESDKPRVFHINLAERHLHLVTLGRKPKLSPDGMRASYLKPDGKTLAVRRVKESPYIENEVIEVAEAENEWFGTYTWAPTSKQIAYSVGKRNKEDLHSVSNVIRIQDV